MKYVTLVGSYAWTTFRVFVGACGSLLSHLGLTVQEAKLDYALALDKAKGVAK